MSFEQRAADLVLEAWREEGISEDEQMRRLQAFADRVAADVRECFERPLPSAAARYAKLLRRRNGRLATR